MDSRSDIPTIHHLESLRRKASYYWPGGVGDPNYFHNHSNFRPALNVRALVSLLSLKPRATSEGEESSTGGHVLRKRRRPETTIPSPSKRVRLAHAVRGHDVQHDEHEGVDDDDDDDYAHQRNMPACPAYWLSPSDVIGEAHETEDSSFLQVYQFGLNLQYNKVVHHDSDHYANDKVATEWGWLEEEEKLRSLLRFRQGDESLPQDIDMGRFFITRYRGRLLALSKPLECPPFWSDELIEEHRERWLLLLPDVPWPDGIDESDLDAQDMQPSGMHRDFITACAALQSHGRAKLEASLQLRIRSEGTYVPTRDFPFELRAHFVLSLAIPKTPPGNSFSRSEVKDLDVQRRLIHFLSKTPLMSSFHGTDNVTIPLFLNSMRPAPPLAQDVIHELLQPDGLLSTLMPFQRRTVAWMLEREGKQITPAGTVVPLDVPEYSSCEAGRRSPLFWEEIELGGRNVFFNRLGGALSFTLPEPHPALGGILAEEPGLGKTMECLSLMLLNPAPERNPSNRRWDPEAHIYVKEIKTTLIVTPPALAAQWVDELAAHAPGLKVLVYDGWTKVGVPITEADMEAERAKRRSMAAQKARSKRKGNARRNGKDGADTLNPGDALDDTGSDPMLDLNANDLDALSDAILDWPSYINQFDVCITTYKVLRTDMCIARAPPERSRRQGVEYKNLTKPRSPLVMCEWYRVIMDEVQMMGAGKSEEMVSLIPRLSSFAVSGTPVLSQVSDLIGILRFLRIDDLVTPRRLWDRILQSRFKDLFVSLFRKYSVRTLKSSVQSELTIPQQQRYLVGIELGRVEQHVYDQALEEVLSELGLDARGVAAYEGWEVDASVLRNALRRLRGICTHPQVGRLLKHGDKMNKPGALKSIGDVLESMKEQNWRNLSDDRKGKVLALTRLAQLKQHCSDDLDRYQRALEYLLTGEADVSELIDEIKALAAQHNAKRRTLENDTGKTTSHRDPHVEEIDKGKRRESERDSLAPIDSDGDDSDGDGDVEDRDLTSAGEDRRAKRIALQARLRECLMALHRIKFLQGGVYHILGSSYSDKEDAAYAEAESLRKNLLKTTEEAANRVMRKLSAATTKKRVTERALQIALPFMKGGGIRSTYLFEEANEIIEEVLNEQSALLWRWRAKVVELLTRRLSSADEPADGEEYARTVDTQSEAEVYLQAYAALLDDRRETILASRTILAAHEGKEKKTRNTRAAAQADSRTQESLELSDGAEVQPQHEVLHEQLSEQRKELQLTERALKSVMVDLSAVAAGIPKESDPEKIIAKNGASRLRTLIASLHELTDKLTDDLAELRKVFNLRVSYFRQLQEISDTVIEVRWEGSLADAITATNRDSANLESKINTGRARQRYLQHLATDGSYTNDDDALCVMCQCTFSRGFITQCAHIFCEGCLKAWIARGYGRACPVCRAPINSRQLQRFTTHEDRQPPAKITLNEGELPPVSYREVHYNMIDPDLFADIQTMESRGSYGSKIQTLTRHLLHIQLVDPGAKSIVFSAWADSLTIIEHALRANDIPCVRLDQNQGKEKAGGAKIFRIDPDLQVLLLHGERDNAGLNVTCASRVFLLESVVNHGFEVQAIARIDRLGQTRATEVFCYYAEDTVEKNILDLAARQGLSLYTKDNSVGSLNVTSFAMDSEKNLIDSPTKPGKRGQPTQKGDFIFKVNDMLAILFPHMFEDINLLLPPDARTAEATRSVDARPAPVPVRREFVNAEAGPSRHSAS